MRATVLFTCKTDDCPAYDKAVDLSKEPIFFDPECAHCKGPGKLQIIASDASFTSKEGYVEFVKACMQEKKLLERLRGAGALDGDDQKRIEYVSAIVEDAVCPCCLKPLPAG
ncbi:hypothetical protein [Bradyrhizobium sp. USDA 4454]